MVNGVDPTYGIAGQDHISPYGEANDIGGMRPPDCDPSP